MSLTVQIVNKSHHPLPSYATIGSSGMDISAFIEKPIVLQPFERSLIPTGLSISIPAHLEV